MTPTELTGPTGLTEPTELTGPTRPPGPARPTQLTQRGMREQVAGRIRAARPALAVRHDLDTFDGLTVAQSAIAAENPDAGASVVMVLRSLDLAAWVRDTCAFALGVDPLAAADWRAAFTRTVFLAGNPAHLRERFDFAHLAPDLSTAWTAPAPAAKTTGLRRLLKLLDGRAALPSRPDTVVRVPGAPGPGGRPRTRRDLYVATADCTVSEALVHVNHVLAEAVLDGLIAPGDRLTLRQVPRLVGLGAPLAQVRVVTEPQLPGRLKAVAGLTEETLVA